MSKGFYTRLAWTGIRKNRQLYYPYLVAGIAMVTVFYIFNFLGASAVVQSLPGSEVLPLLFDYASWAIGLFSIPFLFYTNASLIKKRKGELGLYNILGMNKRNIFSVLAWETLISYGIVMLGGLFSGIVFSKLAELVLVNIMNKAVNYTLYVEWRSVASAILVFAAIYLLILLNTLHQIHCNNPIELLHSDSVGERPPKPHRLPAVISLVMLAAAYVLVGRMGPQIDFLQLFIAGVLLTVGTFLLFLCASVFLCKILQGNKGYYYKTAHFVTVSTMSYRMKRNGASLAAICILVTLVLVTLAFSVSFYVGATEAVENHYPYDLGVSVAIPEDAAAGEFAGEDYTNSLNTELSNTLLQQEPSAQALTAHSANLMAVMVDGRLDLQVDMRSTWYTPGYYNGWEQGGQKIVYLHVLSLEDYNKLCGTAEALGGGEALLTSKTIAYQVDEVVLANGQTMRVRKTGAQIPRMTEVRLGGASLDSHGCEQIYLAVPDVYAFLGGGAGVAQHTAANYLSCNWEYDVKLTAEDARQEALYSAMAAKVKAFGDAAGNTAITSYLKIEKGERFYALAGGLLFLALIMNLLFIAVTALIMYYKQISEGYEDQKRFAIMRKIGMTKREIQKSINSQMLTVFSLPILVAGIHLAFTSNLVYLLLNFSVVDNKPMLIRVMVVCYIFFAIVYTLVYLLTSRTYFKIVNQSVDA